MSEQYISVLQALQLVGLFPCLFIMLFLIMSVRNASKTSIPVVYFGALAVSFYLPLAPLFAWSEAESSQQVMRLMETALPSLSFLLILQLITGRLPHAIYFLILLLPFGGGALIMFQESVDGTICMPSEYCIERNSFKTVYHVLSTSLVYLLLMVLVAKLYSGALKASPYRSHTYWMIVSLIMMSISLPALDLAVLVGMVEKTKAMAIDTVIKFTFIYLVLTSLFRVFDNALGASSRKRKAKEGLSEKDLSLMTSIARLMEVQRVYRKMGYNRQSFAEDMGVPEHRLSKLLNQHYQKNFNEFVNGFRIDEAKERLIHEPATSVTVIAFEVGFSSIASFNRVFKEIVGASPSEYRQQADAA